MITLQNAKQLIIAEARSWGNEIVLLHEAAGRILTEPVTADRDYPPFNRATMDGIAISSSDWNKGARKYAVAATIFAGSTATTTLSHHQCYRIMTGAAVPADADIVIRKEDCVFENDTVTVTTDIVSAGQNIAVKGSDIVKGTNILLPAQLIKPGTVTTMAALGYAEVKVACLPSVAIITTGDEIVQIDAPVNDVQIRNSNLFLLQSLLQQWKIRPAAIRHVKDDKNALLQTIKQQRQYDIIILSGAVSAGDADFVPAVLKEAGAKEIFHTVTIRPGKPIWFGQFEKGPVVFALPGNSYSTYITFRLFIEAFLERSFGIAPAEKLYLPFKGTRTKKNKLDEFFPVQLSGNPTTATSVSFNTSGDITAVMNAAAIALHPSAKETLTDGEIVECFLC